MYATGDVVAGVALLSVCEDETWADARTVLAQISANASEHTGMLRDIQL
jgi:hypothetical protein